MAEMKKAIVWIMVIVMGIALLAGCGGKIPDASASILGTWEYKSMNCAYIFYGDGTGAYRYGGVDMPFTYTDDGAEVRILFTGNTAPNVLKYTVKGKILSIEDSFGSVVEYEKTKDAEAENPDKSAVSSVPEITTGASYDWWEGAWYGWWCIKNGTGSYEPASNIAWDAYAEIEVYNDNTGLLRLWDTGTARDNILVYGYDITFQEGASDKGCMVSARVEFFPNGNWNEGMAATTMDDRTTGWLVDPAVSSVSHFENMIEIAGHYESPENANDSFDYYIYLRPWGTVWDDVRSGDTSGCLYSDMMPIYHDDWYKSLLNLGYGEPPASFQSGIDAINDYLENQGGGGTLDPAAKEGADGIVPLQKLKDLLDWCKKETDYNTTYDEVAAQFGVHGKLTGDDGDYRYYRWLADDDNYIQITFSVKDGQEYWNITQWRGCK